jgi:hypothetical protein
MRTMARAVNGREGIFPRASAGSRGVFEFWAEYTGEGKGFLLAAGIFLVEGLKSVAEEYPEYCTMTIETGPGGRAA